MIERPDWGSGGREMAPAAPIASATDPLGINAKAVEMEGRLAGGAVGPLRPANSDPKRQSTGSVEELSSGLRDKWAREGGIGLNQARAEDAGWRIAIAMGEHNASFVAAINDFSPEIQVKAQDVLRLAPGHGAPIDVGGRLIEQFYSSLTDAEFEMVSAKIENLSSVQKWALLHGLGGGK